MRGFGNSMKARVLLCLLLLAVGAAIYVAQSSRKAPLLKDAAPLARTGSDDASTSAEKTADSGSEEASDGSRMILGKRMVPDKFYLPTMGEIDCFSIIEPLSHKTEEGAELTFPFKLFYDSQGRFLRAEYKKPGAKSYVQEHWVQHDNYRVSQEKISGFPEQAPEVKESALLGVIYENIHLWGDVEDASQLDVTYARLIRKNRYAPPGEPVFILNTYGVAAISDKMPPDREDMKRMRFVMSPTGRILWIDNNL
jgi:hypothetical protein